ncbi:hypothetical protein EDD86DRAFT_196747 [Gorgonomyces haynaldii]|nr:hypothetical protein EDD86DRAFT_196747 [Gorgonomyces haynaldii]
MLRQSLRHIKISFYTALLTSIALSINCIQIGTMPLSLFFERQIQTFNGKLAGLIWTIMQMIFHSRGARVTVSGDKLPKRENALVISNHVSGSDIYLLHFLAKKQKMLSHCTYFAKESLKWIPGFGWGLWLMGMIFIKRNWTNDQELIERAFAKIKRTQKQSWIISFLEGSRLTPKKLQQVS